METKQEWEKIKELFGAALERDPSERAAFLQADSKTAVERDRILELLHCLDWTGVLRHHGVDGQQRNPLDSRLCH